LIDILAREVDSGTHTGWQADPGDIAGGYEISIQDERARAMASSIEKIKRLACAVESVLDSRKAMQLAYID
jgi:hypothetical protein